MKKLRKHHGMGGQNSFMETLPGASPVPNPSHSLHMGAGGLPLFHEGGVRSGGSWETLPPLMEPVQKIGYDEHRRDGFTNPGINLSALEDGGEDGDDGAEEESPPSSKPAPQTSGKMGMGRPSSCGFRGCGFTAKDHGLMAKHRLSSHGLK